MDFKNSNFIKKPEDTKKSEPIIKSANCPICLTSFEFIHFACPTCGLSVREMENPFKPEYIAKKMQAQLKKIILTAKINSTKFSLAELPDN